MFLKRSQAALEFLSTYGWAFLVMLIMIGGLSGIGVLDGSRFTSESCLVGSPFFCERFVVGDDGFRLSLRNSLSESLVVTGFSYEVDEGFVSCDDFSEVTISGGSSIALECAFSGEGVLTGSFRINYRGVTDTSSSFVRNSAGSIRGESVKSSGSSGVSVLGNGGEGSGGTNPLASSECYNSSNIGEIGSWPGCVDMLIVDNNMLRSVASTNAGGNATFGIGFEGDFYTFEDSDFNIFTGQVTNFENLFRNTNFNGSIGYWDTSNVNIMTSLFWNANDFNHYIGGWNVSSVTNMIRTFSGAGSFDQDLSLWDVSSVTRMSQMFGNAERFDQDLSGWNVSSVTRMNQMFWNAERFDQDLSGWDVSNVFRFQQMFHGASEFNHDLSSWNVSDVERMDRMFMNAERFDQDLSGWNVSGVERMDQMFRGALVFNQNLSSWDVSSVTNCANFDLDTPEWDLPKPEFTGCS